MTRLSTFNTDRVSSTDRGVAGNKPDGTGATGGSPANLPAGSAAPLPTYTDAGTPKVQIHKPAGASATGYSVTYSIGGGGSLTATSFPFTITPATAATTFSLYANDTGLSRSSTDVESWNSLFL